jgi:hypothetical protein
MPHVRLRAIAPLVFALVGLLATSSARGELPEGDAPHRYVLHATLDPEAHVVDGRAHITFRNTSAAPLDALYFHLYLNAFAHEGTVFMRESGGRLRGVAAAGRGRIEVLALQTDTGVDLLPSARTDLLPDDETQMRVDLPEALPPGATMALLVRFRSELPPLFARSGYVGDFHIVAQWFPKLAKLEPDGTWATFPYHGLGEFYADFATYDLTVSTPQGFVVGATGRRVEAREEGAWHIQRFVSPWVHDTAFVAWPHFRERTEQVGATRIRVLHPPGYGAAVHRHLTVTRAGLRAFGEAYGSYPYPVLTVVVPPRGAEGGAGMEYPTLFLTWGPWFTVPGVRGGLQDEVTAHELAHQWFQGMVATDEVRWPMLDEGLANWATWDLLGALHGRHRSAFGPPFPPVDGFELLRHFALRMGPRTPPPARPVHAFPTAHDYARAVYGSVPVLLETVARTHGRGRLTRALGTYARRHRFAHPGPEDLYAAVDAEYGGGFSDRVLRPALEDGEDAAVQVASVRSERVDAHTIRTVAVARRTGGVAVPAQVELMGATVPPTRLPPDEAERTVVHRGPNAVSAAVDPQGHILLDPTVLDDARAPRGQRPPAHALTARLLLLVQTLLAGLGP